MLDAAHEKLISRMKEVSPFAACDYTSWTDEGFDLAAALELIDGPVIEVGGPSFTGYPNIFPTSEYANTLPNGRRFLISDKDFNENMPKDIDPDEFTEEDIEFFRRQSTRKYLDLLCRGEALPFADNSVGMLLFSHLPRWDFDNVQQHTIKEAQRVLKPNSLLVAQGIWDVSLEYAKELGFKPKIVFTPEIPHRASDAVLIKNKL